ncbi:MAG: hypothetical protein IJS32_08845, partial [Kiritimatiellae bacterium]|nr:hypothetical protein [Kiritimatiellia bacterium]
RRTDARRTAALMMHTQWMDAFRACGRDEPSALADRYLGGTAKSGWEGGIASICEPETIGDFFAGAVPMLGPFDESHCIAGLFNPHWNAMLLLQTEGAVPVDGKPLPVPKATRLFFMSGEAFCGEEGDPDFGAVLPGGFGKTARPGEPLSPGIWRVFEKARHRFDALYGPEREDINSLRLAALGVLDGFDAKADRERWLPRAALHLKSRAEMMNDTRTALLARQMEKVLRHGGAQLMRQYFAEPGHAEFVRSFSALEPPYHKGMAVYGFADGDDGQLFLFVNREFPRIYATASVPKRERIGYIRKEEVQFEWFDLGRADELLALWNGREAAE